MSRFVRQALVIARRDFTAIVLTPTFLIFLFAPLFMLGVATLSSVGALSVLEGSRTTAVVLAAPQALPGLRAAERRVRAIVGSEPGPPTVQFSSARDPAAVLARADVGAVLADGQVRYKPDARAQADYLALVAAAAEAAPARIGQVRSVAPRAGGRAEGATAFGAVFAMFFLTLLLSSQTISMLAEERNSKVIEVLAAAVPLEAVFLGKLIGMLGVALLFVGFWGMVGITAIQAGAALLGDGALLPGVDLPAFAGLFIGYFILAFLLLGAVFLGLGAQASTMREIQMLSLPVTIFQVAMFSLASASACEPDAPLGLFAALFPFSSPFAMVARGVSGAPAWQHVLAFGWQIGWLALTVTIAARLFRRGVLKSGGVKG